MRRERERMGPGYGDPWWRKSPPSCYVELGLDQVGAEGFDGFDDRVWRQTAHARDLKPSCAQVFQGLEDSKTICGRKEGGQDGSAFRVLRVRIEDDRVSEVRQVRRSS